MAVLEQSAAARLDGSGLCTHTADGFEKTKNPAARPPPTAKALKRLQIPFDWRNYVLYGEEDLLKDF